VTKQSFTNPYNVVIVFCLFLFYFLGTATILYAQIHIANAHIANAHFWSDPCAGQPIGGTCTDGAIYAGTGYSAGGLNPALRYMVTPGGCTDEICTGAGGTDSVTKTWANNSGTTAYGVITGAEDLNNGKLNTAILVNYSPFYTDTDAAHWCSNMNYGGYKGWYLPSLDELTTVLYANKAALGGFAAAIYLSSGEHTNNAFFIDYFTFNSGTGGSDLKTASHYVRCIRSY